MTNSTRTSTHNVTRFARKMKLSDQAPMPVTRLAGWINVGEGKAVPAWIIPTRAPARH